jgi:hypothetical protein
MSSSSNQSPARRSRHRRLNAAWMALLWLGVIVLAIAPFPWW